MIDLHKESVISVPIAEANTSAPFETGLEYGSPARGPWNIVHIGMLLPESHQVFVCAQGCLRGVVLTAAEMGASARFSTVTVDESNLLDGNFEQAMIDGTADILERIPVKPRAVLLFSSCIHHFAACDLRFVLDAMRKRFPDIDFTDCYMTPTLRKTISPDVQMRRQLYSLIRPLPHDSKRINIIGNALAINPDSELLEMLENGGWHVGDITHCQTYEEYLDMGRASYNITMLPSAIAAGDALQARLAQEHIHMPHSYDMDMIEANERALADHLNLPLSDFDILRNDVEHAFAAALIKIGSASVSIDYTATVCPLGLARFLTTRGFNVADVYLDAISNDEADDFAWLQHNVPGLRLHPTVHPAMRVAQRSAGEKALAIGQKAAYFAGTDYFVNLVEGGGLFGFRGMKALANDMADSFLHEKDTRKIVQVKGWGCCG